MRHPDDKHPDDKRPDDKHPDDLHDYLTGALGKVRRAEVQAHLRTCASCRERVRQLNDTLETLVETLPPVSPPPALLDAVKARTLNKKRVTPRQPWRRRWAPWGFAAALSLLLVGTLVWGNQTQRTAQQLQGETRLVADRLASDEAVLLPLRDAVRNSLGSVVLLPDNRALYILKAPPPRARVYQVWGVGANNDTVRLTLSERTVFEVRAVSYRRLRLSLEPAGGSPRPTQVLNEISLLEPN